MVRFSHEHSLLQFKVVYNTSLHEGNIGNLEHKNGHPVKYLPDTQPLIWINGWYFTVYNIVGSVGSRFTNTIGVVLWLCYLYYDVLSWTNSCP